MDQESNWLPQSSDVIAYTSWTPDGETTLKAFSTTLDLAIGRSCAVADKPRQLHIPELYCHSHAFGNAGDRICCIAARPDPDTGDIDVAVSTASHALGQVPGTRSDLEGEVQFWSVGKAWQLTCRWVLGHVGGRCDAIEWCPSIDAFSGDTDGIKRQQAGLGLLLLIADQSALIFSVPVKPKDVVESCSDQLDDLYRVTLQPKVAVPSSRLSNESPTCAKWSPHAPHNEILVGTQWGTVAVIKLHDALDPEEPSYTVCSLVRTDTSSIRALAWAPVEAVPGDAPSDNSTLFCSCAGQALITIYDTRQPQIPVLDLSLGSQGPDANSVLWLEGDGCPLLVVGLVDGTLRRFSLARSPAALGCNLCSTIDGVTSLSYSDNLKLVGYATGGGEAGVLACMARISPLYIEQNGWIGAIRCVPRAPLHKVSYSTATKKGVWSVVTDKEIPTIAPSEYWRARLDVDVKERESVEDLKAMAHPWACITHMLLVDSTSDEMTTCICCTNSCLFMMCKIGLGKDSVAEDLPDPSDDSP